MALTKWRRPRKVTLPGGFVVPVVYHSRRQIEAAFEKAGERVTSENVLGYWDSKRIVICRDEPLWVQAKVFGHELVHAVHDYALWLEHEYADKMKQEASETIAALAEEE